jgi:hypothetical protein
MYSVSGEQEFLSPPSTIQMQMILGRCPRSGQDLAPGRVTGIFVLLLPCAAIHIRDNSR